MMCVTLSVPHRPESDFSLIRQLFSVGSEGSFKEMRWRKKLHGYYFSD